MTAKKTLAEAKQGTRNGCSPSVFNTVIDQGIAGDIALLSAELNDWNERRADLSRWLAAYTGKRATACVDATGTGSSVYQGEIARYNAYTYQGEPTYSTWG